MSRRSCLLALAPIAVSPLGLGYVLASPIARLEPWLGWHGDAVPPAIDIQAPSRVVRGGARVFIRIDDASDWVIHEIDLDGQAIEPVGFDLTIDTTLLHDGPHHLTVRATDRSRRGNVTNADAWFTSRNSGPLLELDPRSNRVGQGQTLLIAVDTDVPATIGGALDKLPLQFVTDGTRGWSLAGFDALDRPGTRRLHLEAYDELGNLTTADFPVVVGAVDYPIEKVWLPPETSGLIGSDQNAREIARLDALFAGVTAVKQWNGLFRRPVQSAIASDFATGRSYNGGPVTSRHWGTDFDSQTGTPVRAPEAGTVVLADRLVVRGNAVIIDHGLGVYSCYYHLSKTSVSVGQRLEVEDLVGLSGETGAVTGPHLHWEMRVRGSAVDPLVWTRQSFP